MTRWLLALVVAFATQSPPAAGTATLRGRVVDVTTGRTVRGSIVSLQIAGADDTEHYLTDERGLFVASDLKPGQYEIAATHGGYFASDDDDRVSTHPLVAVRSGENVVTLPITPQSAIDGRVLDERGEPAPGVKVVLKQPAVVGGVRFVGSLDRSVTSDRNGDFRFTHLHAGSYFVAAAFVPGTPLRIPAAGRSVTYVTRFYPGAPDAEHATAIDLGDGDLRHGIDVRLDAMPARAISGRVTDSHGPVANASLLLRTHHEQSLWSHDDLNDVCEGRSGPDGTFTMVMVAAGSYTLDATWTDDTSDPPLLERGHAEIDVKDTDVANVAVTLASSASPSVTGRVVLDGGGPPLNDDVEIALDLVPQSSKSQSWWAADVAPDLTFRVDHVVPGRFLVDVAAADGWLLSAATLNGADVLGKPFDVGKEDLSGLVLTLTRQRTLLSGQVAAADLAASHHPVAVAFTTRADRWAFGAESRLVQTRPVEGGRFMFNLLLPGDYFVAVVDADDFRAGSGALHFPILSDTKHIIAVGAAGHTFSVVADDNTPDAALLVELARTASRASVPLGARAIVHPAVTRFTDALPGAPAATPSPAPPAPASVTPERRPDTAAIAGVVTDAFGDPAAEVHVQAIRQAGSPTETVARSVETDRTGRYTFNRLEPGDYKIGIGLTVPGMALHRRDASAHDEIVTDGDVYFGGAADLAHATPITVSRGDVRTDVDLKRTLVPASTVAGRIVAAGSTRSDFWVSLRGPEGHLKENGHSTYEPYADRFSFEGVPAGSYRLFAQATVPGSTAREPERRYFGDAAIDSDGVHGMSTTVALAPGTIVRLHITFDGAAPADDNWGRGVDVLPAESGFPYPFAMLGHDATPVKSSDGSYTLTWNGLPAGAFRIATVIPGWRAKSVTRDGVNALNTPLVLKPGDDAIDLLVVFERVRPGAQK
jgi:5-hydroxyisourate hydrolase-like protein (transthyretin family)